MGHNENEHNEHDHAMHLDDLKHDKEQQSRTRKTGPQEDNFEKFKVKGDQLVDKIKELIKEGNARRLIIKDKHGKTLLEIPLTFGVLGVVFAPIAAAVGAIAAMVTECTIYVEKK